MLTDGLYSLLNSATSITAIVGTPATRSDKTTGIFPVQMPEGAPAPAIVFSVVTGGATTMTMDGPDPFRIARVQFSCYAKDYETSKALARAVRQLLDASIGTMADGTPVQNMQTLLEADTFQDAPFLYCTPLDVEISYLDVIGSGSMLPVSNPLGPVAPNGSLQFNDNGNWGGDENLLWDSTDGIFAVGDPNLVNSSGSLQVNANPSSSSSPLPGILIAAIAYSDNATTSSNAYGMNFEMVAADPSVTFTSVWGVNVAGASSASGDVLSLNGVGSQVYNNGTGMVTKQSAFYAISAQDNSTGPVGWNVGYYCEPQYDVGTIGNAAFWSDDQSGGEIDYFLWLDSPGVFRVHGDGVLAYYNPEFSPKYVPASEDFERVVIQWADNVIQIGAQAGTSTGVLRNVEIMGSGVQLDGNFGAYGTTPVAKPTVIGSKGSNAALASLLGALSSQGLLVDSTTA